MLLALGTLMLLQPTLYAQQPEISNWTKNISEGEGASVLGFYDFAHEMVISGNTVHMIWLADSAYHYKLFYRHSLDNGNTWGERQLLAEGVYPTFATPFTSRRLAADGNHVHIAYVDHSGPVSKVWYIRSSNSGVSFSDPQAIFDMTSVFDRLFMSCSGNNLTISVQHEATEQMVYYFLNSTDAGASFTLREYMYGKVAGWSMEDMLRVGNHIYSLIYQSDWYNGLVFGNLHFLTSHDGGETFQSTRISVPATDAHLTYPLQYTSDVGPKIAVAGSHVYVVWNATDSDLEFSLMLRHSPDHGANWDEVVNITKDYAEGPLQLFNGLQTVYAAENYVYVLFATHSNRVYTISSSDYGSSFNTVMELTSPNIPYLDIGGYPRGVIDPADPTGKTFHVIVNTPAYTKTTNGGGNYKKLVTIGTHFSWGLYPSRPRFLPGTNGSFHLALEGRYVYNYEDIFYHRIDPIAQPGANASLKLGYEYGGNRYDCMAVPSAASLQITDAITVEAWVKPQAGSFASAHILSKQDITSTVWNPGTYQLATHGFRQVSAGIRTTAGPLNVYTDNGLPEDAWSHITITYNKDEAENNFKVYVNGLLEKTATASGALEHGDGVLFIGTSNKDTYGFNGLVDEVRIWNHARSEAELQQHMYFPLQGNEPGLAAYYNFNNSTKDLTANGNDGYLMYREEFVAEAIEVPDTDSDGISDLEERGFDGTAICFDGNGDGIPDWKQSDAASLKTWDLNAYVTLSASNPLKVVVPMVNVQAMAPPEGAPQGFAFPYGVFNYDVDLPAGVSNTELQFFAHGSQPFDRYFNYGPLNTAIPEWYNFALEDGTGATLGLNVATLNFIDGQRGDHDRIVNGIITTLGGPAKSPEGLDEPENIAAGFSIRNTSANGLELLFKAPQCEIVTIHLYNTAGQNLAVVYEGMAEPGLNSIHYQLPGLSPGVYFFRLERPNSAQTIKYARLR